VLVARGRAREVARYAWGVAAVNLALALVLIPPMGLEGVAIATTAPYLVAAILLLRLLLAEAPLPPARLARESLLPAWLLGACLAAALGAARALLDPDSLGSVAALGAAGPVVYWGTFYAFWLRPAERRLVRDVARGLVPART
jgi:O-antigen/teichoic acid export membrane protein